MKKKRTIIIKDPYLRRIRDNFRSLLLEASKSAKNKVMERKNLISRKIVENPEDSTLHKRNKELNDQYWEIERPLRASILLCPACFKSDKDMTYNPVRKEWYCTECYTKLKKGFTEEGQPEQFP